MSEPWLLVAPESLTDETRIALDAEESRHVRDVLRCGVGEHLVLADGRGTIARAELVRCRRSRVEAIVIERTRMPEPSGPGVELALGVLHGRAMDWAVQKAVEVGVRRFLPLACERAQVSVRAAGARRAHWCRLARQALKQCRRAWEMEVAAPVQLADLLVAGRPGLVADPAGGTWPAVGSGARATLVVGPEGGLSPEEQEQLADAGWVRLRLGPHTLRAETAAIVGAALLVNTARD